MMLRTQDGPVPGDREWCPLSTWVPARDVPPGCDLEAYVNRYHPERAMAGTSLAAMAGVTAAGHEQVLKSCLDRFKIKAYASGCEAVTTTYTNRQRTA